MTRVLVVAGADGGVGGGSDLATAVAGVDLVIAADRGADALVAVGRLPHVLVGDLDSVSAAARSVCEDAGVEVHELATTKDESDTEYALRLAVSRGATDITVVGALGGPRLDHLLANVHLLTASWLAPCLVRLVDARYEVYLARGDVRPTGRPGDLLTLLPLTPVVNEVETEGLGYPLRRERLLMGSSRGLSNVLGGVVARVRHGEGILLLVHDHDGDPAWMRRGADRPSVTDRPLRSPTDREK